MVGLVIILMRWWWCWSDRTECQGGAPAEGGKELVTNMTNKSNRSTWDLLPKWSLGGGAVDRVEPNQELVVAVEEGNQVLMGGEAWYPDLITLVVAVVLVLETLRVMEEMEDLESL